MLQKSEANNIPSQKNSAVDYFNIDDIVNIRQRKSLKSFEYVDKDYDVNSTLSSLIANEQYDDDFFSMFLMYLLHALPYSQSAFNWLFYAFLNRNLRHSLRYNSNGARSGGLTTTPLEVNGHTSTPKNSASAFPSIGNSSSLWKNMGNYLKNTGLDTNIAVLKKTPFRTKAKVRSR